MKRTLAAVLLIAVLITSFPGAVFAEAPAYDVDKLAVSELSYNETAQGTDISCTVEKINKNDGENVSFTFFTVVRQKGKIISRDYSEYTVSGKSKVYPVNTVEIPENTEGVTVDSFFWDSLTAGKSLAPKASMGSEDNGLLAVYIDGVYVPFDSEDTLKYEFIASLAHEPEIIAVPKDNSATVTVDKITRFPQNVIITVKAASGATKGYTLKVSLAEGKVSDAWMYDNDWVKQNISVDTFRFPDYGKDADGNPIAPPVGKEYENVMPVNKTLVFNDRSMYFVDFPAEFRDAYAVQTSMQLFRYASIYSDKANALAKMGNFTINRSANVYIYMGQNLDWAKADGYTKDDSSVIKMYYTNQQDKNPVSYTGYKRTVIVPEGETADIRIGNYKTEAGSNADYFFIVDFLDPTSIYGVSDLAIDGVSDFSFDSSIYEYDIDLAEGIDLIPDINYTLAGIGATAELTGDATVPGTKTLKVTGASGESVSYKFNFKTFENVLNGIKLDGVALEGFDKYTYDYTYALPFGWKAEDGFPEITTENSSFVNVSVTPATAETMKAEINITADMGTPKTYTITFTETLTRPSVQKEIALGWNTGIIKNNENIYSAGEQLKKDGSEVIYRYSDMYLCMFNQSINWSGYTPVMGYMQLDLTKITEDLDLSKPVKLKLYSRFNFYDKAATGTAAAAPWSDGKVTIYDMSGFDWATANLSTRALAADLTAVNGKPVVASFTAEDVPENTATLRMGTHEIDITEFVKSCIENNNLNPTLGFYVHKPETVTTVRNRIVYWLYKHNSSAMSYIVYNQFE